MENLIKRLIAIGYKLEKAEELYEIYNQANKLDDLIEYVNTKESLQEV